MIPTTTPQAIVQIGFLVAGLIIVGLITLIRVKANDGDGVGCIEIIFALFALALFLGAAAGPQAFVDFWP